MAIYSVQDSGQETQNFLTKMLHLQTCSMSPRIFTSGSTLFSDPWNVSIIQQCRMRITKRDTLQLCLENHEDAFLIVRHEKKSIYKIDYNYLISDSLSRPDLSVLLYVIATVAQYTPCATWDLALDRPRGTQGTKQLQQIVYNIGRPIS